MDQLTQSGVGEAQSDTLKVFMEAALQKHEASILTKLSEHEKSLRAEIAAKEGYGQQLGAKVAYLQVCKHLFALCFFYLYLHLFHITLYFRMSCGV